MATGRAIDPWDVDKYPVDWKEAIRSFMVDLPEAIYSLKHGTPVE